MAGKLGTLEAVAKPLARGGQAARVVADAALQAWSRAQGLTLREGVAAALTAGIFPECYERNFPALSAAQQLRLWESRVLILGLGGLGGYLATLLARTGVGKLRLADGDLFTPANRNRQLLATGETLGQGKALVTARHLAALNPALEIEAIPDFLDARRLPAHLAGVRVALDGLDRIRTRRELFPVIQQAGVPLVHAAVQGRHGQVATILPGDREVWGKFYPGGSSLPEEPPEVLAPTVSLVASLQVQEALRLLLGQPPAYHGRLAHFDGDTGRLEIVELGGGRG